MPAQQTRIDGPESGTIASRKSRHGHRMWISWRDQDGWHADLATPATIKAALLANGTQGRNWYLIEGGISTVGFWWMWLNVIRQMKRGWR